MSMHRGSTRSAVLLQDNEVDGIGNHEVHRTREFWGHTGEFCQAERCTSHGKVCCRISLARYSSTSTLCSAIDIFS